MNARQNTDESGSASVLVLGDGGWGTAIALTLHRAGHDVRLWSVDDAYARSMSESRQNPKYLPGIDLPSDLTIGSSAADLSRDVKAIFSVIPTQHLRTAWQALSPNLPTNVPIASCSKGVEKGTLKLPSEILEEILPDARITVFSGPSHAEEVARDLPTTVVAASPNGQDAELIQSLFHRTHLRVYTARDCRGVELGGAVKNVIAIAAGVSDGLGFGDNSRAALVARGLVEIARLGVALGASPETFAGLSGMGDLITTCTSQHSRNHTVGFRIGKGETLQDILRSTEMVAEGVETSRSVHELRQRVGVEMPICEEVYTVLHGGKSAREAGVSLMSREVKAETELF